MNTDDAGVDAFSAQALHRVLAHHARDRATALMHTRLERVHATASRRGEAGMSAKEEEQNSVLLLLLGCRRPTRSSQAKGKSAKEEEPSPPRKNKEK